MHMCMHMSHVHAAPFTRQAAVWAQKEVPSLKFEEERRANSQRQAEMQAEIVKQQEVQGRELSLL